LVLRESSMPSVLVETGFVSNQAEANYLKSDDGQQVIASSILDAFRRFKAKSSGAIVPERQIVNSSTKPDTSALTVLPEKKKESKPEEKTLLIAEENKPETSKKITSIEKTGSTEVPITSADTLAKNEITGGNTYYSVQIGANTTPVEPIAQNFKGLKEVRREKTDKYYRYYIGKETSIESITPILQQIKLKFSQAFIVYFIDGKRTIINTNSN
jgi:N-acetylmuramoyl-L-alanine amidase